MKTKPIIEQHFHGAFGIDFNTASKEDILFVAKEITKYGIEGIFPTIVTDSIDNTKRAISNIKEAAKQNISGAKIFGIHLEGIFLNPEKKGIHNEKFFLEPTIDNYRLVEDDFIKIVTLAPEMISHKEHLIEYLTSKGIKVQAGHCTGSDLTGCTGVTHLFNAMSGIHHRNKSTALSALLDDNIYTEIIADGIHVSDDALKLVFKTKPLNKIILISDCLPCTGSNIKEFNFAGEQIFYNGIKATSKEGTIAGSTTLLPTIIKLLNDKKIIDEKMTVQLINNIYEYHGIETDNFIEWDANRNIIR